MENVTANDSAACSISLIPALASIDVATAVLGHAVSGLLLRSLCASGKAADVLNVNVALLQHAYSLMCALHLVGLFVPGLPPPHRLYQFLFLFAQVGMPGSLTLVCVERYVAVLHPTVYPRLRRRRRRELAAAGVWLCALLPASGFLLSQGEAPRVEGAFRIVPCSLMVCMVSVMVSCSSRMAKTLRRGGPAGDAPQPYKRRALWTVRLTCLLTLLFYAPVTTLQQLKVKELMEHCVITPVCVGLLSAGSLGHPLLYLATQRQGRRRATPPHKP